MTAAPPDIMIQEVAPRDGLQIETKWVETSEKIRLINSLSAIGLVVSKSPRSYRPLPCRRCVMRQTSSPASSGVPARFTRR